MSKKSLFYISVGVLNLLHGLTHIVQFVQSIFLITYSSSCDHGSWLHHPAFSFLWAFIGISSLIIGIRDYRHHKKCDH